MSANGHQAAPRKNERGQAQVWQAKNQDVYRLQAIEAAKKVQSDMAEWSSGSLPLSVRHSQVQVWPG